MRCDHSLWNFVLFCVCLSRLFYDQTLTCHFLRLLLAHQLDQRRDDVRKASALTKLRAGIRVYKNERNRVRGVRRERSAGRVVDQLLCVSVVSADEHHAVHFLHKVDNLTDTFVDDFDCLGRCLQYTGVAYHVGVCEVADDDIVVRVSVLILLRDGLAEAVAYRVCAHTRLLVIGRNVLRRVDENSVLVCVRSLYSAVEEEGNVSVFLGLGDTCLAHSLRSKPLAEGVGNLNLLERDGLVRDRHVVLGEAYIGKRQESVSSCEAVILEILTAERARNLSCAVGTEVEENDGIIFLDSRRRGTVFEDEPYSYPDGSPVNNASMNFGGATTIRLAITNSVNVVAVKCLEQVTPQLGLKYLDDFGFTTLAHGTEADTDMYGNVYTDATLATALGGITNGVINVELCAAYAAIANGGTYIKPIYYTKILDHNGNVLIENNSVGRTVIRESTAWLLTSAMQDVVTKGTGTACQLPNMPVAGKTGTTEDYNDLWFVGYTPFYTCAVWSGYDNNEKLPEYARTFHQGLWRKVMTRIHQDLPPRDFPMAASVQMATICEESGLLPSEGCPTITEYFEAATIPTEYCYGHDNDWEEEEEEAIRESLEQFVTYNPDGTITLPDGTNAIPTTAPDGTGNPNNMNGNENPDMNTNIEEWDGGNGWGDENTDVEWDYTENY